MSNGFFDSTTGELIGVAAIIFALTIGVGGCKFLEGIHSSKAVEKDVESSFSLEEISTAFILGLKAGWDSANDGKCSTENCVFLMDNFVKTTDCPWWPSVRRRVYGDSGVVTEFERNSD